MNALRFCERAATPWAGCVFSSSRSDTACVLLWWMSTLTETIIQLRLPLFARWRREVDRYVARARVPIVYTAYNIDVDRTIYDWKSFVIDTRLALWNRIHRGFKSMYHKTYTYDYKYIISVIHWTSTKAHNLYCYQTKCAEFSRISVRIKYFTMYHIHLT